MSSIIAEIIGLSVIRIKTSVNRRLCLLAATELFAWFDAQEACCHISQAAEEQYPFRSTSSSPIDEGYLLQSMAQS